MTMQLHHLMRLATTIVCVEALSNDAAAQTQNVGVSLHDYYELNVGTPAAPVFEDNPFGYASVAGIVTVPFSGTTAFGAWNVHGGVEFLALGETTKALNGGDGHRVVGSIGFGFA